MCFGGGPKQQAPATPAPAPPPPSPVADETSVTDARRAEDSQNFGPGGQQSLRVDRSVTSGGIGSGGSGIKVT